MRAFIHAVGILLIVATSGIAYAIPAPPVIPIETRKFDHAKHEASAANAPAAGRRKADCGDCHQYNADGTRKKAKEHATRCVKCHQDPATCTAQMKTSQAPTNPARRCVQCHVFQKCIAPGMPMPPSTNTFQAGFSHGKHIGFGAAIERECATCHTEQAPAGQLNRTAGGGHALCKDCHSAGGRSKLIMTNCAGCHSPAKGKAAPSGDPFRLARFDHRRHHTDSKQSSCTTCHTTKGMAAGSDLPRPAMLVCQEACHNGQKAFSAVGTKCTTCHKSTGGSVQPNRNDLAFSHATHAARNTNIAKCDACHSLKDDGNIEPHGTNKNHMPCAASGCHQIEFASKTTKICGVCHDQSMPWQKAHARTRPPLKKEWFNTMNHQVHLKQGAATNATCINCHGDKLGGGKRPHDHDACAQCHGKGAPAHAMTECAKCHLQTKPAGMVATEWSVRDTFKHEQHARDPRGNRAAQCANCHADVKNAKDLATIKKPTMDSCTSCHDGKITFKATGYECMKCHTPSKQPSTPVSLRSFNDPNLSAAPRRWDGSESEGS